MGALLDDFEGGTRPAGRCAVVLAPGRGFGYLGTGWRAWQGHSGRQGAAARRRGAAPVARGMGVRLEALPPGTISGVLGIPLPCDNDDISRQRHTG